MIRIPTTLADLQAEVDAEKPGWRDRAAAHTARFVAAGAYDESSGIWSEIKGAYMRIQNDKCAYCERWLAGPVVGAIEHDVEHYRPKKRVRGWSGASRMDFPVQKGRAQGYHWLAYDLLNYVTACKPCNSTLKHTRFPISGQPGAPGQSVAELNAVEQPLLLYPLADVDPDDPAECLGFQGFVAMARPSATEPRRRRALATIDFFELNERSELQLGRARVVKDTWHALRRREQAETDQERQEATEDLELLTSHTHEHSLCARDFIALFEDDPIQAWNHYQTARDLYARLARGRVH